MQNWEKRKIFIYILLFFYFMMKTKNDCISLFHCTLGLQIFGGFFFTLSLDTNAKTVAFHPMFYVELLSHSTSYELDHSSHKLIKIPLNKTLYRNKYIDWIWSQGYQVVMAVNVLERSVIMTSALLPTLMILQQPIILHSKTPRPMLTLIMKSVVPLTARNVYSLSNTRVLNTQNVLQRTQRTLLHGVQSM